ncbi:MAG: TetR/AcrR family transcriptional regulator [Thalassovita sp.]
MSKSLSKKELILESTQSLLVEAGGAALTMRKVAEHAGISLGNLQYHFATRDLLLEALLARFVDGYVQDLNLQHIQSSGDLQQDLEALLGAILQASDFDEGGALFKELWAAAQTSAGMAKVLTSYYQRLGQIYAQTLRQLVPAAQSDAQIQNAVAVLMPLFEGYCVTQSAMSMPRPQLAQIWTTAVVAALNAPVTSPDTAAQSG